MTNFFSIKIGDKVNRSFDNIATAMQLVVSDVTPTKIICSDWEFCRLTGGEIDADLGWDGIDTGSYLILPDEELH